jgi:hypothetical protein
MPVRYLAGFTVLILTAVLSKAQSYEPGNGWFTHNYHLTGPPPAGEVRPAPPEVELQDLQNTVLAILWDFEAALAAAAQAVSNIELKAELAQSAQAARVAQGAQNTKPEPAAVYLIALKDHTIYAATSYWVDSRMLHYVTPQGAHEQVRLDLVDRGFSTELNRHLNQAFRLPQ